MASLGVGGEEEGIKRGGKYFVPLASARTAGVGYALP